MSLNHFGEIAYVQQMKISTAKNPENIKYITCEKLDKSNVDILKNGFIEVIQKPEFVRIYFDFDSIETKDDYEIVINWLDELSLIAGNYSIGGYTNNKDLFGHLYKYIPNAHHTLSLHVVFYETKIKASLFVEIMKHDKFGYKYYINKQCDPNVYKLNTEQKFRHVYSDKIYSFGDANNRQTSGSFLKETKISESVIQIIGNERELTEDDIKKMFHLSDMIYILLKSNSSKSNKQSEDSSAYRAAQQAEPKKEEQKKEQKKEEQKKIYDDFNDLISEEEDDTYTQEKPAKPAKRSHHKKKGTIDDLEFEDELIEFSKEEMIEFLDNFENRFNTVLEDLGALWHSPYSKEFLIESVGEWYLKAEHDKPEQYKDIINRYYEKEDSNRWFFSLIKKLDEDKRKEYLNKYTKSIDFTITINNSETTYKDIKHKRYELNNIVDLFNDLRGVFGVIDDKWYVKVNTKLDPEEKGQRNIKIISQETLRKNLTTFKPFKGNNSISLYQIVAKFSNIFMYDDAIFAKEVEPNQINLFQGFKYEEIETNDFTIIKPFLEHIKNIICNGEEEKYDYFMKWFANIFQKITVKNGTMLIIYGAQGSGKSFPIEVFAELIGVHGIANVDDLEKVFGKFNGLLGSQTMFININEPPEATEKFKFTGKFKSKLTQKKQIQETKNVDSFEMICWSNFCMTTNNYAPIQEEKGNRRAIYFETSNSKCGDEKYFDELCKPIQEVKQGPYNEKFMGVLLHYMKTKIDVKDFNTERLIREINSDYKKEYNEQLERQYADLNVVDRYVVDNYKNFINGKWLESLEGTLAQSMPGYTLKGVAKRLNSVCIGDRIYNNESKEKKQIFILKPRKENPDLFSIIDYIHYNEEDIDKEEEKNKQLEEEYVKLNDVEKCIVNNYIKFLKWYSLEEIEKEIQIQNKKELSDILNNYCKKEMRKQKNGDKIPFL